MPEKVSNLQPLNLNLYTLRHVARIMLPLYRKAAQNCSYAERLCRAIRSNGDAEAIIRQEVPVEGLETAKVGFFVCFGFPGPELCNGTILRSGRKRFDTSRFRAIAATVIPFYKKLIRSRSYSLKILRAVRSGNKSKTFRIIQNTLRSPHFHSVKANRNELRLYFRFNDGTMYENAFF